MNNDETLEVAACDGEVFTFVAYCAPEIICRRESDTVAKQGPAGKQALEVEVKLDADAGFTLPDLSGLPGVARVDAGETASSRPSTSTARTCA